MAQISTRSLSGTGCPDFYEENVGNIIREAYVKKRGSLTEAYPEIAETNWAPFRIISSSMSH